MTPQACSNVFSYYVGDTKTMTFKALYSSGLSPLDLTNCTEIVVNLPNADGTITQLKFSSGQVTIASPTVLGQASAIISAALWASPNVGVGQDLDVTYTIGGNPQTVKFPGALSVFQP